MKDIQLFISSIIVITIIIIFFRSASAQADLPTPVLIPTQLHSSSNTTFPNFLRCSQADQDTIGSSWEGVVIGESTTQDILDVVMNWTDNFEIHARSLESDVEYRLNIRTSIDRTGTHRSPSSIRFCTVENKVLLLAVTYPVGSELYLEILISSYGIPSAVLYDVGHPNGRLVFWDDIGIVARVFSGEEIESFGRVSTVIYFPPVSEGAREVWSFTVGAENYDGELNPFMFQDIVATLTAQPTINPTPTFTPLPQPVTPTP